VNGPDHFCTKGPNALQQNANKAKPFTNTHLRLTPPRWGLFKGLTTRQGLCLSIKWNFHRNYSAPPPFGKPLKINNLRSISNLENPKFNGFCQNLLNFWAFFQGNRS
jgi:hypothetical protein